MEILSLPTVSAHRSYLVWQSLSIRCFPSVTPPLDLSARGISHIVRNHLESFPPEYDSTHTSSPKTIGNKISRKMAFTSFTVFICSSLPWASHSIRPPPWVLPWLFQHLPLEIVTVFFQHVSPSRCYTLWKHRKYMYLLIIFITVSSPGVGSLEQQLRVWSGARLLGSIYDSSPAVCVNLGKLLKLLVLQLTCLKNRYFNKSVYLLGKIK